MLKLAKKTYRFKYSRNWIIYPIQKRSKMNLGSGGFEDKILILNVHYNTKRKILFTNICSRVNN